MNKKGFALSFPIILVGLLIIGSIGVLIATGNIKLADITGQGSYIERPVFSYVKCEAISDIKYSTPSPLPTDSSLSKPSVASSYNVLITTPNLYFNQQGVGTSGLRIEYSVCNSNVLSSSNCRIYQQQFTSGTVNTIQGIKNNEYVFAYYEYLNPLTLYKWKVTSGATYQIGWVPYALRAYDVLSGSANQIGIKNGADCSISLSDESWKDRFISTDSKTIASVISSNTNQNVLQPEEVRWYVSGHLTSAAPSFELNYHGQDAWCRTTGDTGTIYKINTVILGSGTYKIASPDYSDELGTETCCPGATNGDSVCSTSFIWIKITGSDCGAFKSCGSPNPVPYSTKQTIQYYCDNGYCKSKITNVACASDYDCKDTNQICDLNSFTCVNANVNLNGQTIKTIPDNAADCEKAGGTWKSTSTTENVATLLCPFGLFGVCTQNTIVNSYCDMGGWNIGKILIVFLIIIVTIVLLFFAWKSGVLKKAFSMIKGLPFFLKIIAIIILLILIILPFTPP